MLWVALAESSVNSSKALARMPKSGYVFENLLSFYANSPVLLHWLNRRRLELNPKGTRSSRSGAGATASGCASNCGCNDCRSSRR